MIFFERFWAIYIFFIISNFRGLLKPPRLRGFLSKASGNTDLVHLFKVLGVL